MEIEKYTLRAYSPQSLEEISSLPQLLSTEIQIFTISLQPFCRYLRRLRENLSQREREKITKFCFRKDAELFAVTHGILREIVGHYLAVSPQDLFFCSLPGGKPVLSSYRHIALSFNISHSGEKAIIALSLQGEIGVDVEFIRPFTTFMEVAERFFHPQEFFDIKVVADEMKLQKFYEIWTQKESVIKALGTGLSTPLNLFRVIGEYDQWTNVIFSFSQGKTSVYSRILPKIEDYHCAISFIPPHS